MRELTFIKSGVLRWNDVAEPTLSCPTDVLVRPFIASRCDGDAFYLRHNFRKLLAAGAMLHLIDGEFRRAQSDPFAGPFAYGHECVAEILQCGSEVRNFSAGDVVIVPWAISCGQCSTCGAGLTAKCGPARGERPVAAFGFGQAFGTNGGMVSDVLRVPWADSMLVAVPPAVDPLAVASASDNLCDGYRTVAHHLRRSPGAPVLVVGGGAKSIGLYAAGIAHALGSCRVDYVDTCPVRLQMASQLGANPVERAQSARWFRAGEPLLAGGYPIAVDASSTTSGLAYALAALAPGGTCTGVGFYVRQGTPLPLWNMYLKSATLHVGVANARADLPALLDLLQQGNFDPTIVTSLVAAWDDAPSALLERSTKVVLRREPLSQRAA
jgi:threonine dehydrogenase-like Zn-dependent dehydrogenase